MLMLSGQSVQSFTKLPGVRMPYFRRLAGQLLTAGNVEFERE